jgi:hypothetical protein
VHQRGYAILSIDHTILAPYIKYPLKCVYIISMDTVVTWLVHGYAMFTLRLLLRDNWKGLLTLSKILKSSVIMIDLLENFDSSTVKCIIVLQLINNAFRKPRGGHKSATGGDRIWCSPGHPTEERGRENPTRAPHVCAAGNLSLMIFRAFTPC